MRIVAAFVLGLAGLSVASRFAPQPALADQFVYRPGYQRFNRYQYRNHAWFRAGVFLAPSAGFYPSIGYLGFVPPPVYAVPIYPPYAYPAPFFSPAVPYAFGSAAVPFFYRSPTPFGFAYPHGPFARGYGRYRGYRMRAWGVRYGGYAPRYGSYRGFRR